jgi:KDO2-lipid IV(A) lauroyltransferase
VVQVLPPIALEPQADGLETVRHMTQVYTRAIEAAIRLQPEQWFWSHRRWKPAPTSGVEESRGRP